MDYFSYYNTIMDQSFTSQRISLVKAALGQEPFDLLICNVQVVNVHTGQIEPGNIGIYQGRVATTHALQDAPAHKVLDGEGNFAIPGFIDTHVHIDSLC